MRFGVCAYGWMPKVVPNGLNFVEGGVPYLLVPNEPESVFEEKLREARAYHIPIETGVVFLPGDLKTTGPTVDEKTLDAYARITLARAGKAGMKIMAFGSGTSRNVPDGFPKERALEQLAGHLTRWAPIARDAGITFAVEPLQSKETNILNRLSDVVELVRRVDRPNVRALADTFHISMQGDGPEAVVAAGDLVAHVHISEKPTRTAPGTHGEDFRPFFRALKQIGYDQRISIECGWGDVQKEFPGALAEMIKQYESA